MNRGKAGGWACALLDEDRYYTVESEEGSHCGRIYEDFPWLTPCLFPDPVVIAREGELEKLREKNVPDCVII